MRHSEAIEPDESTHDAAPLRRWAAFVALLGAFERVLIWLSYAPVSYGDTPSYMRLAGQLAGVSLRGYDGTRTPAYPAFMAILGSDPQRIWLAQMTLGWLTSILLFFVAWRMTKNPAVAGLVALAYNLLPAMILFESNLIAESLTTFWIVLSLALLIVLLGAPHAVAGVVTAFVLGVTASLAALTRPLFYILPVWFLPFVWLAGGGSSRQRLARTAIYSVAPLILLGGWLSFIYQSYEIFSPTTMSGYQLVQHTGAFFEYLPDQDGVIRDIYLKYRDRKIAESGVQTNAIWDAIPELSQATGLSFYALSGELERLSFVLIREHPVRYLKSAAEGWTWFWKAPAYWRPDLFPPPVRGVLRAWVVAGRIVELLSNAIFLVASMAMVVSAQVRKRIRPTAGVAAVAGLVWLTSIVQTLVDHGDNPRFLVPLQMLVILFVVWTVWRWMRSTPAQVVER